MASLNCVDALIVIRGSRLASPSCSQVNSGSTNFSLRLRIALLNRHVPSSHPIVPNAGATGTPVLRCRGCVRLGQASANLKPVSSACELFPYFALRYKDFIGHNILTHVHYCPDVSMVHELLLHCTGVPTASSHEQYCGASRACSLVPRPMLSRLSCKRHSDCQWSEATVRPSRRLLLRNASVSGATKGRAHS